MEQVKNKQKTRTTVLILSFCISMCFVLLPYCSQPEKQTETQVEQTSGEPGIDTMEKKFKNPTNPSDEDGLARGKSLYSENCKS